MKGKNMGAFENIEELKTTLTDCTSENNRISGMLYNPSDKGQIRYRYNFYCDHIKDLEEVAGDLIYFCKDLIENSPKVNYEFYCDEVFHNLNNALEGKKKNTLWYRSNELLLWYFDEVKIHEQRERNGDCIYVWNKEGQLWQKPKDSDLFYLMSNYQDQNHALFEYCRLRESFEYKLLSLLCHYKDSKNGNVNIDYARPMIVFAHTICLYTAMYNERKLVRKDAKHARLNLEELQTTTSVPQGKRTESVTIPHELDTPEGRALLQKVIKAGFCNENYVWDSSKWDNGDDLIALAYFVEKANRYLGLIRPVRGKNIISWKPFDTLFTYRTKKKRADNKSQLQIARTNFMQYARMKSFKPNTKVMEAIDALFR